MPRIRRLLLRLINVFRSARGETDLAHELETHRDLLTADLERRGLPGRDARLAAERALGSVEQATDLYRRERTLVWIDDARRDVSYAVRMLWRSPLFAVTTVLSLAIGVGAN